MSGGSGSAVPRREPVPFSGTVQRRPGCSSFAARMIAVTAVLSLLAETAAAAPSQPSSRTQQASAIREKGMLTVQQLSTSNSNVRVRLDGGQLSLAGRLVNYTGRLDRRPSLEDSAVTVAFDLSSIQSDPGSGSVYLNPDVLFRSIPDPRIQFQSTRITKNAPKRNELSFPRQENSAHPTFPQPKQPFP